MRAIAIGTLLAPVLALTFFGGVYTAVWAGLVAATGALLIALSVLQLRSGHVAVAPRYVWWVWAPALLALVLGAVQLLPIAGAGLAHPMWAAASDVLQRPTAATISLTPADTFDVLLRFGCYLGLFWLALQVGRDRHTARALLAGLVVAVTAFAVYGLVVQLIGLEMILWLEKKAYRGDLTGTLVNRNTAASVIGMGWISATALLLGQLRARLQGSEAPSERRRLLVAYLSGKGLWLIGAWVALFSALLLTHSRAGFAAALAGLIVVLVLLLSRRTFGQWTRRTVAGLVTVATLLVVALSGDLTLDRIVGTRPQGEQRFEVYPVIWRAFHDAPIIGTGLGSFREVFRIYQPPYVTGKWGMAHNSYLELLLEGGGPLGILVFFVGSMAVTRCLLGGNKRKKDAHIPIAAGAVGVHLSLHSGIDFSLQFPGVTGLAVILLGVGVAQSWSLAKSLSYYD